MKFLLTFILATFSVAALADHPNLSVNGSLDLVYDETVEVLDLNVDTVSQFNHLAPQILDIDIRKNKKVDDIEIDGSAIGNNADLDVSDDLVIVQGNQIGGQYATVDIRRNKKLDEVDVDLTAVGNNASVVTLDEVFLGNVQFNKLAPTVVSVDIVANNRHGHHNHHYVIEPDLDLTAIGNNLNVEGGVSGIDSVQLNKFSPQIMDIDIRRNRGVVGDINIDGTVVGNNLSVSIDD